MDHNKSIWKKEIIHGAISGSASAVKEAFSQLLKQEVIMRVDHRRHEVGTKLLQSIKKD